MLPLEGITVLDLTRRYPGAYAAMFLADFGANVIKVDAPGEVVTMAGIDVKQLTEEKYAAYFAPDRNKSSIILNLKHEQGKQVLYRLVKQADILIEGFRPGVMKRLKADYETLKEVNPRLIYCALTGFGQDGPYALRPGHDWNYSAIAGALSLIGEKGGRPYLANNFLADMAGAGLHTVIGALMALRARDLTGRGQFIDITYLEGVISLMTMDISFFMLTGKVPKRGEYPLSGGEVFANIYRCKDGEYITLGAAEPHFWKNFCRYIEREDLIPLQRPPAEKKDEVFSALEQIFLTKTRDEWEEFFKDKDTCFGPVNYLDEALSNAQVLHREMVIEVDHPNLGKIKQIGFPIKLSDTPARIRNLGVVSGTNTEEILESLGYSGEEISQLRQSGIVVQPE